MKGLIHVIIWIALVVVGIFIGKSLLSDDHQADIAIPTPTHINQTSTSKLRPK